MKAQAFRPNFLNIPSMAKDKQLEGKVTDEERALYTLSSFAGWKILSGFIDGLVKDLDNVNTTAIANGASFEDIGQNTVVINIAKGIINRILTKVSDARETCEKLNE